MQTSDDSEDTDMESHDDDMSPDFSTTVGRSSKYHLYTHASVDNVVYNLGPRAFEGTGYSKLSLTPAATFLWNKFTQPKVQRIMADIAPALKIRIPGGNMAKKKS